MKACLLILVLGCVSASAAEFEVGVSRINITPPTPYWLSGYAARTNAAPSVLQDLWAKALAVSDPQGHKVVIVTMDLIGLPGEISREVTTKAQKEFNLDPSQLVLNCSHTHGGPAVGRNLSVLFDFSPEDEQAVRDYSTALAAKLLRVIGEALGNRTPANLAVTDGSVGFAVNRRVSTPKGYVIGVNTNGPVDHTVPVLRVEGPDGQLRAVLFGYSCHNTTLGGDCYQVNADYAGYAQAALEKKHPGLTALFLMLCGGDQNPHPRGTVSLARQHGEALAEEVDRVLGETPTRLRPPIVAASEVAQLDFAPHTRALFEEELRGTDKFRQRRARLMLAAYDQGQPIRHLSYPMQAVRFGQNFTILALGGEVVVDYAIRVKREYAGQNLVVSGYCTEVACYIPSRRVLLEGGYEPVESMIYYGQPGLFCDNVEEKIFSAVHNILRQVGVMNAAATAQPTAK